jgi:hypothetical protein
MSRHKGSPRLKIAITIAAIWISSALIAISDGVHFTLVKTPDISFCNEVPFTIYGRKYLRYRSVLLEYHPEIGKAFFIPSKP